jgi:hypothetical protein
MYAISSFDALNTVWLRLSQNNATGDGGTCYGDSGGPNFLGSSGMIAGITITGDSMCFATNVDYRLDTPSARSFLAQFVTLPSYKAQHSQRIMREPGPRSAAGPGSDFLLKPPTIVW